MGARLGCPCLSLMPCPTLWRQRAEHCKFKAFFSCTKLEARKPASKTEKKRKQKALVVANNCVEYLACWYFKGMMSVDVVFFVCLFVPDCLPFYMEIISTRQALPGFPSLTALCPSSALSSWGIYCLWFRSIHMACAYVSETWAVQLYFLKWMLLKKKEKDPDGFTIFYFHAFYKLIREGISDWGVWRSQDTGGSCPESLPPLELNFPGPSTVLGCSPTGTQKKSAGRMNGPART